MRRKETLLPMRRHVHTTIAAARTTARTLAARQARATASTTWLSALPDAGVDVSVERDCGPTAARAPKGDDDAADSITSTPTTSSTITPSASDTFAIAWKRAATRSGSSLRMLATTRTLAALTLSVMDVASTESVRASEALYAS